MDDPRIITSTPTMTFWRLENRHIEPLQQIISAPEVGTLWRSRGAYWAPYQVQAQLTRDVLVSAVATSGKDPDGDILGLVEVLDPSMLDGRAQLSALVAEPYLSTGVGIEMVLGFVDFVFASYPIDKLQIETHATNSRLMAGLRRLLHHEGTFTRHLNVHGTWHDVELFALWRTDMERLHRVLRRAQV